MNESALVSPERYIEAQHHSLHKSGDREAVTWTGLKAHPGQWKSLHNFKLSCTCCFIRSLVILSEKWAGGLTNEETEVYID